MAHVRSQRRPNAQQKIVFLIPDEAARQHPGPDRMYLPAATEAIHSFPTFKRWESVDTPNGAEMSIVHVVRLSHSSKLKAAKVFS